jgi:hypothetical protein
LCNLIEICSTAEIFDLVLMDEQLSMKNSKIAGCSWLYLAADLCKKRGSARQSRPAGCYFAAFNSEISGGRVNREGGDELFGPDPRRWRRRGRQLPTGSEAW